MFQFEVDRLRVTRGRSALQYCAWAGFRGNQGLEQTSPPQQWRIGHILNLAVRPNELRKVRFEGPGQGLLGYHKKSWRQVSAAAYSLVWTRWYTSNMSNAVPPNTLAVFAVGGTLVYCYELRPSICDTKKPYVQEEQDVTKSGHQYYTLSCIYHVAKNPYAQLLNIFGVLLQYGNVITRYIILYVLLLYHKNMYWYA